MKRFIPNKGEQMCRYYGYYSNKSRGLRKNKASKEKEPEISKSDITRKKRQKTWARLIQKVWEVEPLKCQICGLF